MNSHRTRDVPRPLERLLRRVESAFAFSNIWQRPSFAEAQRRLEAACRRLPTPRGSLDESCASTTPSSRTALREGPAKKGSHGARQPLRPDP